MIISSSQDILLLYDGSYRESRLPHPVTKQTSCPSIPIADLYTDCVYPTGYEMPYTVSILSYMCTIIYSGASLIRTL